MPVLRLYFLFIYLFLEFFLSVYSYVCAYIYTYTYKCICVCMCVYIYLVRTSFSSFCRQSGQLVSPLFATNEGNLAFYCKVFVPERNLYVVSPVTTRCSFFIECLSVLMPWCCFQDLRGPKEPLLGPFVLPNLPKKGEQIQVRVKHLLTPNKVSTNPEAFWHWRLINSKSKMSYRC